MCLSVNGMYTSNFLWNTQSETGERVLKLDQGYFWNSIIQGVE